LISTPNGESAFRTALEIVRGVGPRRRLRPVLSSRKTEIARTALANGASVRAAAKLAGISKSAAGKLAKAALHRHSDADPRVPGRRRSPAALECCGDQPSHVPRERPKRASEAPGERHEVADRAVWQPLAQFRPKRGESRRAAQGRAHSSHTLPCPRPTQSARPDCPRRRPPGSVGPELTKRADLTHKRTGRVQRADRNGTQPGNLPFRYGYGT
jgi:hypothetical protein